MGQEIVSYREKLAEQAAQYAAEVPASGGTFLSTKGGVLSFGDEQLPGNQACVIILDTVKENTFYDGKYDPNVSATPICYAFGRGAEDMAPHESMQQAPEYFIPQAESCAVCPHAEWGSSDTGKGRACQNRARLALIPAGFYIPKKRSRDFDLELFDDPKHFASADIAYLKLPVMSVKGWYQYITQLSASMRLPPHGVITRLYIEPDVKAQYRVKFELLEEVPEALLPAIMARHDEAVASIVQGYAPPREEDKVQAKVGSLRGLRRG